MNIHATCISIKGKGVLLMGPSGCGKSDLALRLIGQGAVLVADDQTALEVKEGALMASCPSPIQGKMEVRGVGLVSFEAVSQAVVALAIELVDSALVPRMPTFAETEIQGIKIPIFRLSGLEASAPDKVRLLLDLDPSFFA